MSFCQKCGADNGVGNKFCCTCGTPIGVAPQPQARYAVPQTGRLHCPNCKSISFASTTETTVSSLTTSSGRTHTGTTHRDYWICTVCGTKFRNIQSLEAEIARSSKSRKSLLVMTCVLLFIFILLLLFNDVGFIALPFQIIIAFLCLVCFIASLSATKSIKGCMAELEYLKSNCFN